MKRYLIAALVLILLLTGCGTVEETTPAQTTEPVATTEPLSVHANDLDNGKEWMPWEDATSLPGIDENQYNYYLTTDVSLTSTETVTGIDMGLCLNGHTITANESGRVYVLAMDSKMTVCDCSENPGTIIPGANGAGAFQLSGDNVELTLRNLTIDGASAGMVAPKTGAIVIDGVKSVLTLDGVTVSGCTAVNGSAVYAVGQKETPATVNIVNGSVIKGNTVLDSTEGSAAVLGRYATINVSDSTFTENESKAICGVAISFAGGGTLNLHNATIVNNHSAYVPPTPEHMQVGAVYIHNGSRNVSISGDTVIKDNTRHDGMVSNLYLQKSVREVNPDRYPEPLHIMLGGLTDNAHIGIFPGLHYEMAVFAEDLYQIPLMDTKSIADVSSWQDNWITIDNTDQQIVYDADEMQFMIKDMAQ